MDSILILKQEDQKLRVGALVKVYWSAYGYSFQSRGRVHRLQVQEAEVQLLSPIPGSRDYPQIKSVTLP